MDARSCDVSPDYFANPHPEFAAALVVHWLLYRYAPREVALTYDFTAIAAILAYSKMSL